MAYQSIYTGGQVDEAVGRAAPQGPIQSQLDALQGQMLGFHGLVIKGGPFASLAALQAAVPNPQVGDSYSVGASAPYDIYNWNGTQWINYGDIGTVGAVRFDQTQSLTASEQSRARTNIGAGNVATLSYTIISTWT